MAEIKRDAALDGLKFVLICLVIVGHCIEPTRYSSAMSGMLYSIIYSFHMPLFVLLSGYFSKSIELKKFSLQTLQLLETYIIMATAIGVMMGWGLSMLYVPTLSCWYILCLIVWRFLFLWFKKKGYNNRTILLCSFGICFISYFLPFYNRLEYFSFMRLTQLLPFFAIGYCMDYKWILHLRENKNIKNYLCVTCILLFCLCCIFSSRPLHVLEFHRDTLFSFTTIFSWKWYTTLFSNITLMLMAFIVTMFLLSIRKYPELFCKYGRYSLVFYFVQGLIAHKLPLMLPINIGTEIALSIVVIIIGGMISMYYPSITNPITSLIIKKK